MLLSSFPSNVHRQKPQLPQTTQKCCKTRSSGHSAHFFSPAHCQEICQEIRTFGRTAVPARICRQNVPGPNSRPPAQTLARRASAGQNASLFLLSFCNSFKDLSLIYSRRSLMSLPFSHMYDEPSVLFVRVNSSKSSRYQCFGVLPQWPPKRSMREV